jgi:hypothetical protein
LKRLLSPSRISGLALLVGAALLVGLAQTGTGADALGSLGLHSQAEGFTELGFQASGSLPDHVGGPGDGTSMPFIIGNHEGEQRSYAWIVEQRTGDGTRELAHGTTPQLGDARSTLVTPAVTVDCGAPGDRVRVIVRLADPAQSIAFWTRCAKDGA